MNTVPTTTAIHATITTKRWVTHQRATRRISFLLSRSPPIGNSEHEPTHENAPCRRPTGPTVTTPPDAQATLGVGLTHAERTTHGYPHRGTRRTSAQRGVTRVDDHKCGG